MPQIDAVVAAGERIPAIGQTPDALAESERDHQEIDAGRANREQPENSRQRRAEQNSSHDHQPEIISQSELVLGRENRCQIGADREIGRLSERGEAGIAEQNVDAHYQDRKSQDPRCEQDEERVGVRNDDRECCERSNNKQNLDLLTVHRFPLIPVRTVRSA